MLYFDSVATTPIKQSVYASMIPYLTSKYGNSSSMYSLGYEARQAIEEAREKVAASIGADPSEIFFTSCGSESNTWALNGVKKTMDCTLWGKALVSSIEHHSVLNAINAKKIDVDEYGKIIEQDLIDTKEPEKLSAKSYSPPLPVTVLPLPVFVWPCVVIVPSPLLPGFPIVIPPFLVLQVHYK